MTPVERLDQASVVVQLVAGLCITIAIVGLVILSVMAAIWLEERWGR